MAKTDELEIPDEPASGYVRFQPLGGDGMSDPIAAYSVRLDATGDASGGTHTLRIKPDPQYCSLVSYMVGHQINATGDVNARMGVSPEDGSSTLFFTTLNHTDINLSAGNATAIRVFSPPPLILSPSSQEADEWLYLQVANTNGRESRLLARIYVFQKIARERTPMSVLVACLARGVTQV